MEIETKVVGGIMVAKLCDTRLDAAQALRFKEGLRELSEAGASVEHGCEHVGWAARWHGACDAGGWAVGAV